MLSMGLLNRKKCPPPWFLKNTGFLLIKKCFKTFKSRLQQVVDVLDLGLSILFASYLTSVFLTLFLFWAILRAQSIQQFIALQNVLLLWVLVWVFLHSFYAPFLPVSCFAYCINMTFWRNVLINTAYFWVNAKVNWVFICC